VAGPERGASGDEGGGVVGGRGEAWGGLE